MSKKEPIPESNENSEIDEVKSELIKLAKKIEKGELEKNELTEQITDNIAEAIMLLARAVELGAISDDEMLNYLTKIIRKLTKGKYKTLKNRKKKPKTIIGIIANIILKHFAQQNARDQAAKAQKEPMANKLAADLEAAVADLIASPSLDSDVNDVRLMENAIAVIEKMSALANFNTKGLSNLLSKAARAYANVSGNKGITDLSTLKAEMANSSWSEVNEIDYESVGRYVGEANEKTSIKETLASKISEAQIPSGPDNVPTTETAKELKARKNKEWEQSM